MMFLFIVSLQVFRDVYQTNRESVPRHTFLHKSENVSIDRKREVRRLTGSLKFLTFGLFNFLTFKHYFTYGILTRWKILILE